MTKIQRLRARVENLQDENAKLRGMLVYIQSLAPDVSAAYYPPNEQKLYVDNFKQIGEQVTKMLKGLSS